MIFKKSKTTEEIASLNLHGLSINYKVKYSKRRSIEIRVYKGQVLVAAPTGARKQGVEHFLHKKADWIIEKLNKHSGHINISVPKDICQGQLLHFMGKTYEVDIRRDIASRIELGPNKMIIHHPTLNQKKINALVKNWYKQQTEFVFNERLHECLKLAAKIGVTKAQGLSTRKMKNRWGTCTHDNKIILNSNLIYLGLEYIDYVILHELCHFKEKNHSPRYYALLASLCPDYKAIRKRLNMFDIG